MPKGSPCKLNKELSNQGRLSSRPGWPIFFLTFAQREEARGKDSSRRASSDRHDFIPPPAPSIRRQTATPAPATPKIPPRAPRRFLPPLQTRLAAPRR